MKNIPISNDVNTIFKSLIKKIWLNLNKLLFLRKINSNKELNQEEMEVAMGIIIKPISLK